MNFLESYGYMDSVLIHIQIPIMFHLERKLLELRGCLLLVCRDDIDSREFTIYEMVKGCYVWSARYLVDTDDFMTRMMVDSVYTWSIILGEMEENSFLVINLSGKCRVLICEMEALGARGVAVDCVECLKQTQAREPDKLVALTEVLVET
uniref:Uncharacterized protein n=1 Tax=Tanacetum cinerariifolium TaxID=118510 RepID=A0A6L2LZB0_TANCI|nr:hypothetical protein [Tanacetum cinerariifolium]